MLFMKGILENLITIKKSFLPFLILLIVMTCYLIPVHAEPNTTSDTSSTNTVTEENGTVRAKTDQEKKQEKQTSINFSLPTSYQGRTVYLKNINGTTIKKVTVDAMGNFDLNDINPGSYYVTIVKNGPQTIKNTKKGYPFSYIVMAMIVSAIFSGIVMWMAGVTKTKRKYAYLREFEYDIHLDGDLVDDTLIYDEDQEDQKNVGISRFKKAKKKKAKKAQEKPTSGLKRRGK